MLTGNNLIEKRIASLLNQKGGIGNTALDINAKRGEAGMGELFNYLNKDQIIHVIETDTWYEWNGIHWEATTPQRIKIRFVHLEKLLTLRLEEIYRERQIQEKKNLTDDPFDPFTKNSRSCKRKSNHSNIQMMDSLLNDLKCSLHNIRSVYGMENIMKSSLSTYDNPPLEIKASIMDHNPYFLTVKNGTIDLTTGTLRPTSMNDYCSHCAPVEWKGIDAKCPLWEKTLYEIFGENQEVLNYFQRLIGMSLIGEVQEKNFIFLLGEEGDSGKTTIFEIIFKIIGDYIAPIPVELLLDQGIPQNPNSPNSSVMDLKGRRICWASEPSDNRRFSADRIKLMSGGDTLIGRYPFQKQSVTFQPTHTLFMLSNNEPHVASSDSAFWKRLRKINCPFEFVDNPHNPNQRQVDRTLKHRILSNEASGVLAWMVRGCLDYFEKQGSCPPETIMADTEKYRRKEDKILTFMDECLVTSEGNRIPATKMYEYFKEWHEKYISRSCPSIQWFGREMKRHGVKSIISHQHFYVDIDFAS